MAKTIDPTDYIAGYAVTGTTPNKKIEMPVADLASSLSEAEAETDIRKFLFALLQTIYTVTEAAATADKLTNMTIRKVSFSGESSIRRQFVIEFTNTFTNEDVQAEA